MRNYVNDYQKILEQMQESPVIQDFNSQKNNQVKLIEDIMSGKNKARLMELAGTKPKHIPTPLEIQFNNTLTKKPPVLETFAPADISQEVNTIINELHQEELNYEDSKEVEEFNSTTQEAPKYTIQELREKLAETEEIRKKNNQTIFSRPQPASHSETLFRDVERMLSYDEPKIQKSDYPYPTAPSLYPRPKSRMPYESPTPINFIRSIKEREEEKMRKYQQQLDKEIRIKKWTERKTFWKEFSLTGYFKEKVSQAFNYITGKINKVIAVVNDWRFQMSLSKNQRELVKGWKKSAHSQGLMRLALKRNINLNEMKNMNSRMDAIPE